MENALPDLSRQIRETKAALRAALPHYRETFAAVDAAIRQQLAIQDAERENGISPIPQITAQAICDHSVDPDLVARIKARGCCVIQGLFAESQARAWNHEIGDYLQDNGFDPRQPSTAKDGYFATLNSNTPPIFPVYWSPPQVAARQHPNMVQAQQFLNRLWDTDSPEGPVFDPERLVSYADRVRRRPAGSHGRGLSAHVDGGSVERWLDPGFRYVYRHIFDGNWANYDPFAARGRTDVKEIPSPAVCAMFRTFQGWTALTPQHGGSGSLNLLPLANAMAWILLRALQDDVPDDSLCGAAPGRALAINERWHSLLVSHMAPIPRMRPGDAVFWHCDVVHGVEQSHTGEDDSNVIYIAAIPWCAKNQAYLAGQWQAFLAGNTPPDFAADNLEATYRGRGDASSLTPLGRTMLGG